jgi:hypothetical protein
MANVVTKRSEVRSSIPLVHAEDVPETLSKPLLGAFWRGARGHRNGVPRSANPSIDSNTLRGARWSFWNRGWDAAERFRGGAVES